MKRLMREMWLKRPRLRWFVSVLIAGAVTVAAVELLAVLVYPVIVEQPYSRSRIQNDLAKIKASAPRPEADLGAGNATPAATTTRPGTK